MSSVFLFHLISSSWMLLDALGLKWLVQEFSRDEDRPSRSMAHKQNQTCVARLKLSMFRYIAARSDSTVALFLIHFGCFVFWQHQKRLVQTDQHVSTPRPHCKRHEQEREWTWHQYRDVLSAVGAIQLQAYSTKRRKAVKTVKIFVFHSSNSQRVFSEPRPAWCFPFDLVDGWPSCLLFSVTQSWLRHQTRRVYSRHIQHVELEHHKDLRMTCVQVVIGFRQRQRLFHRFEAARNVENRQPLLYTKFPKGTEGYCSAHLHCVRMQSLDHRFAATQHDVHRLQWMCTSCQLVERG